MKLTSLICGAGLALLMAQASAVAQGYGPKVADAKPGDIRVYATASLMTPLQAVAEQAKKAIGKNIVFEYGASKGNLQSEILAGNGDFEMAILVPDVDEKILAAGKVMPGTYPLARVLIGFGIRGTATVDVSNAAAIKKTLLNATSVKYAPTGMGAGSIAKLFTGLDIGDKVKDSGKLREEVPLTGDQYEILVYPMSELLANKSVTKILGPIIDQFQAPGNIEATIGAHPNDLATAKALVKFLQGPAMDVSLKTSGMEKMVK